MRSEKGDGPKGQKAPPDPRCCPFTARALTVNKRFDPFPIGFIESDSIVRYVRPPSAVIVNKRRIAAMMQSPSANFSSELLRRSRRDSRVPAPSPPRLARRASFCLYDGT